MLGSKKMIASVQAWLNGKEADATTASDDL